jgi:hypothetical protein
MQSLRRVKRVQLGGRNQPDLFVEMSIAERLGLLR